MENQQPEALRLADKLKDAIQLLDLGFDEDIDPDELGKAALELESLHARVQELEGMLDSVGAGGVSAQRITRADARDAQRYRWLRAQPLESDIFCITIWRKGTDGFGDDLRLEKLDDAIDAAIAAAKGE